MTRTFTIVRCDNCGQILEEPPGLNTEDKKPCPICGSTSRRYGIDVNEEVVPREKLRLKAKHTKKKKEKERPYCEIVTGDDLQRSTGIWMRIERIIDRIRDKYREIVTEPKTGKIVHHCEEPLSDHQQHGSAKPNEKRK